MRTIFVAVIVVIGLIIGGLYGLTRAHQQHAQSAARAPSSKSQTAHTSQPEKPSQPSFDKHKFSTDKASSLWVVANKHRPLKPLKYTPKLAVPHVPLRLSPKNSEMHLNPRAIKPLERLFAAAEKHGYHLQLASGYRSYQEQVSVYHHEVNSVGKKQADRESARPGHSEHQTGLSADVEPTSRKCEVAQCFGKLPVGKWLAKSAYKFGFVIRYPKGYEHVTGYEWEPWHIRYTGTYLSKQMHQTHSKTLEQFFHLGAAPTYQ
jgi:D-alanyl-D-alanine carboxypeptidase